MLAILTSSKIIEKGDNFKIIKDTKYIVFGHFHPECAINDSLIPSLKNYAQYGESYFYTYFKAKKIIESNAQIKTIFIEYTNNQITVGMNKWIWSNEHISSRYPKYAILINMVEFFFLTFKNPISMSISQTQCLKDNLNFITNTEKNYIDYKAWGGYLYLVRAKTDSLIQALPKVAETENNNNEISETNIQYLLKTIEFCKSKGVKVYLIRCPVHSLYSALSNETKYKEILKTKFPNTEYLDFENFTLHNTEFGDFEHLNYKGAKIFSVFFNRLLTSNVLNIKYKQEFIDSEIEKLKQLN
jgi:hypothetical protein